MQNDFLTDFFNGGIAVPKNAQADNKTAFQLTSNEVAFINSIEFFEKSFKSFMTAVIADLEEKVKTKNDEFKDIKTEFIRALAAKHGLSSTDNVRVDIRNELLTVNK